MNYKFIPRFYYALSPFSYFKLRKKKSNSIYKKAVSLNSARTGLRILLSSASNKGLKVGVQSYTCHTVFQAIQKAGHIPVFIDMTEGLQLCLVDLKIKINQLDALIVTHTFGFPERMEKIKAIAQDVVIIEDCAHSFLSSRKGVITGELGDASIFSTGLGKFPAIGAGGFCLINDKDKFPFFDEEYSKMTPVKYLSRSISFIKTLFFSILMKAPFYGLITYPLGKMMDSKLDFIDKFSFKENLNSSWVNRVFYSNQKTFLKQLDIQKSNANYLLSLLNTNIKTITINTGDEPNYYVFPILIEHRDQLFTELLENNIEPGKHFSKSLIWAQEFGYNSGDSNITEMIIKQVITLPIHKGINKNGIKKMAEIVNKYA